MKRKLVLAAAGFAASVAIASAALAGANDYAFEPVKAEIKKGRGVILIVRLVHKPSSKPVSDAVVFSPRIDMTPEGMATMTVPVTAVAGAEPGTYGFKTDLVMAGRLASDGFSQGAGRA
jgi:hypothetical protein